MSIKLTTIDDPKLVKIINDGGVGVLPTDTVYGLVCRALDVQAVERLYKLKNRERKPGTIIAASVEQLIELGLKARYLKPIQHYWPNAISVVIPCTFGLPYLHQGVGALAVRVVADKTLNSLLQKTGPLLTSSANLPAELPANTIEEAHRYFEEDIDFYVDGGDLSGQKPSTLMRVVDDAVEVLREGAVNINEEGEIIT